jgi:ectoine hydroxylase-related dioxygenase (phytanoyl-CoA dioxygenase family)
MHIYNRVEMVQAVFREVAKQVQFDVDGYIHLKGFLSAAEVEALKAAYFELLPESGGAMSGDETDFKNTNEITYDFTFIDRNSAYKQKVFDRIEAAFAAHFEPILADYTPIIANFIRKEADGGEVPLHQNWAFVDEMKYTSVSIWVPLVDSNRDNGTLEITPGSHKRFGRFRGPMVPWELDHIKEDIIRDFMVPMNATAGDAVILDDSVVHYSNINTTQGLRLTIQLILVPKNTVSIHYHLDRTVSANEVRVLEVDRDFYMKFHPWKRPEGKEIGTRKFHLHYLTRAEFEAKLSGPEFTQLPDLDMLPQPELEIVNSAPAAVTSTSEKIGFLDRLKRIFS